MEPEIEMREGPNRLALLLGVGLGAALMFILDPERGARRRALVRDKSVKLLKKGTRTVRNRGEDIGNRLVGVAAETRGRLKDSPTDDQLEARVRAELGHSIEHPKSIDVVADDGFVTLRGNVLKDEVHDVLEAVRGVRGVRDVRSEMQVQESTADLDI
jgi:osmotically-inducible protein OsmY